MGCDLDGIAWALELDGFLSLCLIAVWLWVSYLTSLNPVENNSAYSLEGWLPWLWHNGLESDCTG